MSLKKKVLFAEFPNIFLMINVQENPRNNKSIEFVLSKGLPWTSFKFDLLRC